MTFGKKEFYYFLYKIFYMYSPCLIYKFVLVPIKQFFPYKHYAPLPLGSLVHFNCIHHPVDATQIIHAHAVQCVRNKTNLMVSMWYII